MIFPTLPTQDTTRQFIDTFSGYNHNLRIDDNQFYDMKNISSNNYPILSPREARGVFAKSGTYTGMIAKDNLCYIDGQYFVMNEYRVDMGLNSEPKTLVSMGAYVIILPDKKYINTANLSDFGSIEAEYNSLSDVTFSLCNVTGDNYDNIVPSAVALEDTTKTWLDTSYKPYVLKKYASASSMWVTVPTTYIKITASGIGSKFSEGDGITISGIKAAGLDDLNSNIIIQKKDENYIVVIGLLDETKTQTNAQGAITVKRAMPDMDFVVESCNRLWGCRYGISDKGDVVNEIYSSKLGDFKNWNCFAGISTDSYRASLGTDGQFTGAITHGGYPIFFKENCLHKVYGSYPSNFSIQDLTCRGVQKGSAKSLAIVNEILYYKSRLGICAYDGSLPVEISGVLGYIAYFNAVSGAHGNKYYISMSDSTGTYHLFVYDTSKGMWHKEDNTNVKQFCSCKNEMYYIDNADGFIKTIFGSGTKDNSKIDWYAETGIIGASDPDKKYISNLNIRMSLNISSSVSIYIQYDSSGVWEHIKTLTGHSLKSFNVPIKPCRCDHMRLKISGNGAAKIFSICKTMEQGSDT